MKKPAKKGYPASKPNPQQREFDQAPRDARGSGAGRPSVEDLPLGDRSPAGMGAAPPSHGGGHAHHSSHKVPGGTLHHSTQFVPDTDNDGM